MKKILIGTHNQGKFKELAYLLAKRYRKISPKSLKLPSPKETGKTFLSNSKLKAKFFSKFVDYSIISDDSGLCIKSLGNKPGIHSARWAKKYGGFKKAMRLILKKLKGQKNRSAFFICSLTYINPSGKTVSVVGKIAGKISDEMLGNNGFGYDPIFVPLKEKITFGQMRKSKKINMDHRHIAFQKLKKKTKIL